MGLKGVGRGDTARRETDEEDAARSIGATEGTSTLEEEKHEQHDHAGSPNDPDDDERATAVRYDL